jgi:iron complex outermembrane receptor protein
MFVLAMGTAWIRAIMARRRKQFVFITGALVLGASPMGAPSAADLQQPVPLEIAAQPLESSLLELSRQSHLQIVIATASLPHVVAERVSGTMPLKTALEIVLKGSGLTYKIVGDQTIAIVSVSSGNANSLHEEAGGAAPEKQEQTNTGQKTTQHNKLISKVAAFFLICTNGFVGNAVCADDPLEEIVVTARKQRESIVDVPQSVAVLSGETLANMDVHNFADYASKVPDLTFSYGSGSQGFSNARTIAIRGISGRGLEGVGTTAVYIDDIAVDEQMDPRVLDVERIEVLRGPQGTLFGEGSLGGAVRIVSAKPDLTHDDLSYTGAGGVTSHGGSPDYDGGLTGNLVLSDGSVALRATAFVAHDAGFITRRYPGADGSLEAANNQGAEYSYGGSLAARFKFTDAFEARLRVMTQWSQDYGFPATYAPFPAFRPSDLTMNRVVNLQETANDGWVVPSLELSYDSDHWSLASATSYVWRNDRETEDSTEGTAQIVQQFFAYTTPTYAELWRQSIDTRRINEELRASYKDNPYVTGTFGAYYSQLRTSITQPPYYIPGIAAAGLYPSDLGWDMDIEDVLQDRALFGEAYLTLLPRTTITLGARYYKLTQHYGFTSDGIISGGLNSSDVGNRQSGVSPKAAIEYKVAPNVGVYASASKGFRPGNGTTPLPQYCWSALPELGLTPQSALKYGSDTVWDYEVGAKAQAKHLLITGSLYQLNWANIQQTTFLPSCGYTFTTNAGAARNRGAELEISGSITEKWSTHFGVGYDHAVITEQGNSAQAPGSPVHEIPRVTASIGLAFSQPLTSAVTGRISGDFSYIGTSYSAVTNFFVPQARPSYELLNMQFGVSQGRNELSVYGRNLTNKKANLGDLNPIAYNKTVDGAVVPEVVVERPVTVGIRFTHNFE